MKKMAIAPKKAKSSTGVSRSTAEHPPLWVMLKAALTNLKDRKGSSRQAIVKYIQSNYHVQSTGKFKSAMKRCISKAVTEGKLIKTKGSFKLSSEEKSLKKHKASSGGLKKASNKLRKVSAGGLAHKKPKSLKKSKPKSPKPAGGAANANLGPGGPAAAKKVKKTAATKHPKKSKPKAAPKK